ncbi:hypothetical protein [Pedobacter sp. NJ-S-72]
MEGAYKTFEYDTKLNVIFNKKLSSKFDLDGLVGANYNDRGFRYLTTTVEDLAIPDFFDISNSSNSPISTEQESHRRLFGAYAQATLGYDKYLYLTVTGRNDWSSTLAPGKKTAISILLPVYLSLLPNYLTFLKHQSAF